MQWDWPVACTSTRTNTQLTRDGCGDAGETLTFDQFGFVVSPTNQELCLQVKIPSNVETPAGSPSRQTQQEVLSHTFEHNFERDSLFNDNNRKCCFYRICSLPPWFSHQFTSWMFSSMRPLTCVLWWLNHLLGLQHSVKAHHSYRLPWLTFHLIRCFQSVLIHVQMLWELVLLGEPVVVMAPSPTVSSETVLALVR